MTSTYSRSLSSDFGGNLKPTQLQTEINQNSNIDPICIVVTNRNGDNVDIKFNEALTSEEETTLNSLISVHSPTSNSKSSFFKVSPIHQKTNQTTYQKMATTYYEGSNNIGPINEIYITSNMDVNITDYQVRVIDHSNGQIIASQSSLNNTTLQQISLGTISNIPSEPTLLEVQIKKTGSNSNQYVHLTEIIIYHDN